MYVVDVLSTNTLNRSRSLIGSHKIFGGETWKNSTVPARFKPSRFTTCPNLLPLTSLRVWIRHHRRHQPRHSYIWSLAIFGVWNASQLSVHRPLRWGLRPRRPIALFNARQLASVFVLPLWPLARFWFESVSGFSSFLQVGEVMVEWLRCRLGHC